jgi:hypothetical protein
MPEFYHIEGEMMCEFIDFFASITMTSKAGASSNHALEDIKASCSYKPSPHSK